MSIFKRAPNLDDPGFSSTMSYQTVPLNAECVLYAFQLGVLDLTIEDESIAIQSSSQIMDVNKKHAGATQRFTKVTLKGVAPGTTNLVAEDSWVPGNSERLKLVVAADKDFRLINDAGICSNDPDIRKLLTTDLTGGLLGIKDVAVRIAEDQMNSKLGRAANGGTNRYSKLTNDDGKPIDWCGAFAFWCYKKASELLPATNPLGDNVDNMLSPQKAITWATLNPDRANVIGYSGPGILVDDKKGSRMKRATQNGLSTIIDLDTSFDTVTTGDICLLRDDKNWRHVSLVYEAPAWGDDFQTIDGNQGSPSISIVSRTQSQLQVGYQYVFIHVEQ